MTELQRALRRALRSRDQSMLNALAVSAVTIGGLRDEDVEAMMREALAEMPHETQDWWNGPCQLCRAELS